MTFEEDFPSLKEKFCYAESKQKLLFKSDIIRKYCLDKLKVKDAVNKWFDVELENIDGFLKELGLDK